MEGKTNQPQVWPQILVAWQRQQQQYVESRNVITITEITAITAMRMAIEMEYAVRCIIEREFQHPSARQQEKEWERMSEWDGNSVRCRASLCNYIHPHTHTHSLACSFTHIKHYQYGGHCAWRPLANQRIVIAGLSVCVWLRVCVCANR